MNHHVARVEEEYETAVSRARNASIKIEEGNSKNSTSDR